METNEKTEYKDFNIYYVGEDYFDNEYDAKDGNFYVVHKYKTDMALKTKMYLSKETIDLCENAENAWYKSVNEAKLYIDEYHNNAS